MLPAGGRRGHRRDLPRARRPDPRPDPRRARGGELCVCDIATLAGISESAVSHQLRLLRGMRLVRPRRAGRQVFYTLDDQHIVQLLRVAITHVQEGGAR